jgi:hypothetical protein
VRSSSSAIDQAWLRSEFRFGNQSLPCEFREMFGS